HGAPRVVHLVALVGAAAVKVKNVALLERALRAGRAQHHGNAGRNVGAALIVVMQDALLDAAGADAGPELCDHLVPGLASYLAGLAQAVDLPVAFYQAAAPDYGTGVD